MKNFTLKCDVLVIGTGAAGCAAALSAAGNNAHVILLESEKQIGGTVEKARLTGFCGFFKNDLPLPELLNPFGISLEITEHLKFQGFKPYKYGRVWIQPVTKLFMRDFFMPRINASSSIEFYSGTIIDRILIESNRIIELTCKKEDSQLRIEPRNVIDCSGAGLCKSGFPDGYYIKDICPRAQAAALTFILKNAEKVNRLKHLELLYKLKKAIQSGDMPDSCAVTDFENGFEDEIIGRINLPQDITPERLNEILSADIHKLVKYLRENINGFEKSELVILNKDLSMRVGCRIKGKYQLSETDLLKGTVFQDAHIQAAWPMEEWNASKGQTLKYLESAYTIPDRALTSSECENLFAGGGTISSNLKAHSSLRVCGTVFASGERSGVLASYN